MCEESRPTVSRSSPCHEKAFLEKFCKVVPFRTMLANGRPNKIKITFAGSVCGHVKKLYPITVHFEQGCSGAGTRGNGVPTPFSCFALK